MGELLHHVNKQYKVLGYTKPNAGLHELLSTAKESISKLTKKDWIVILGGTNDIEKNQHNKNLTSIENLLMDSQHVNIILVDVPFRYDLKKRCNINEEIIVYNRKVHKLIKKFHNVQAVEAITDRNLFTRHGLQLNGKGKEIMINRIIEKVINNTGSCKTKTIYLPWKMETMYSW